MSLCDVQPQSWYLYDVKWTAKRDAVLLHELIAMKDECYPAPPYKSPHALLCVLNYLNKHFTANLRLIDVEERVAFLEGRYRTFKRISSMTETHWDLERKMVLAPESVWHKIIKVDTFAEAYFYRDEPEYNQMSLLFGIDGIKAERSRSRTVVVLSDSQIAKVGINNGGEEADTSDDEVCSPPFIGSQKLARRLFEEDDVPRGSQSKKTIAHTYWRWPSIEARLQFPGKNAFSPKPINVEGQPREGDAVPGHGKGHDGGVGDSSVASSWSP